MSEYTFLDPQSSFPLPATFNYEEYIETEQELWALFPETDGRRVNFVQIGLTAQIYAEVPENGQELEFDETYILMPCADLTMRPIRTGRAAFEGGHPENMDRRHSAIHARFAKIQTSGKEASAEHVRTAPQHVACRCLDRDWHGSAE